MVDWIISTSISETTIISHYDIQNTMSSRDKQTLDGDRKEEDKLGVILMVSVTTGLSITPVLFWDELFSFLYSLSTSGLLGLFISYFGILGVIHYVLIKRAGHSEEPS